MAVANALNAAADRIEKTTQVLNRTIGNGVAIGIFSENVLRPAWFETPALRAPHHEGLAFRRTSGPHPEERATARVSKDGRGRQRLAKCDSPPGGE